jgi:nicotinamide phosphoribosyltransferase
VADGYDFFKFISEDLPHFKDQIMARDGKVVVRPDSGNPVNIICGYSAVRTNLTFDEVVQKTQSQSGHMRIWNGNECLYTADGRYITQDGEITELEALGAMRILHKVFGGRVNSKHCIELDPHIGLIYGDSITYERCERICATLHDMGFSSTNCVYGIGSYTYTYNTRDTFGFACKATANVINGQTNAIFKQPKTDKGGMKKSAKGYLQVHKDNGRIVLHNDCENDDGGLLQTVFENGIQTVRPSITEIRERLANA